MVVVRQSFFLNSKCPPHHVQRRHINFNRPNRHSGRDGARRLSPFSVQRRPWSFQGAPPSSDRNFQLFIRGSHVQYPARFSIPRSIIPRNRQQCLAWVCSLHPSPGTRGRTSCQPPRTLPPAPVPLPHPLHNRPITPTECRHHTRDSHFHASPPVSCVAHRVSARPSRTPEMDALVLYAERAALLIPSTLRADVDRACWVRPLLYSRPFPRPGTQSPPSIESMYQGPRQGR